MLVGAYGYDLGEDGLYRALGENAASLDNVAIVKLYVLIPESYDVGNEKNKRNDEPEEKYSPPLEGR